MTDHDAIDPDLLIGWELPTSLFGMSNGKPLILKISHISKQNTIVTYPIETTNIIHYTNFLEKEPRPVDLSRLNEEHRKWVEEQMLIASAHERRRVARSPAIESTILSKETLIMTSHTGEVMSEFEDLMTVTALKQFKKEYETRKKKEQLRLLREKKERKGKEEEISEVELRLFLQRARELAEIRTKTAAKAAVAATVTKSSCLETIQLAYPYSDLEYMYKFVYKEKPQSIEPVPVSIVDTPFIDITLVRVQSIINVYIHMLYPELVNLILSKELAIDTFKAYEAIDTEEEVEDELRMRRSIQCDMFLAHKAALGVVLALERLSDYTASKPTYALFSIELMECIYLATTIIDTEHAGHEHMREVPLFAHNLQILLSTKTAALNGEEQRIRTTITSGIETVFLMCERIWTKILKHSERTETPADILVTLQQWTLVGQQMFIKDQMNTKFREMEEERTKVTEDMKRANKTAEWIVAGKGGIQNPH